MKTQEINISDLNAKLDYLRIRLDLKFLKNMFIKAANNRHPHYSKELMAQLKMKPTKGLNSCLTIHGWFTGKSSIPLKKLAKISELSKTNWGRIVKHIISIKSNYNGAEIKPNFPLKVDKKLGSIIGYILGDGSICKNQQKVFFSNSDKGLLKEFESNMRDIFGVEPRIWMQKDSEYGKTEWDKRLSTINELKKGRTCGLFYPHICGIILNAVFDNFAIGKDKMITTKIIESNKYFKASLIRAFYDDESTVTEKSIRVFQDRKDILDMFRIFLNEFDISPSKIKMYLKRNKKRYYFDIFKKSNLRKFEAEIGFTSQKKLEKLYAITRKKKHWNDK